MPSFISSSTEQEPEVKYDAKTSNVRLVSTLKGWAVLLLLLVMLCALVTLTVAICYDCLSSSTRDRTGSDQSQPKMVVKHFVQVEEFFSPHLRWVHAKYTAVAFEFLTQVHVSVSQSVERSRTLLEPTRSTKIKPMTELRNNNMNMKTTAMTGMMVTIATKQCLIIISVGPFARTQSLE